MVVVGTEDRMVPTEGVAEANRQMQAAYDWAGKPDYFRAYNPPKVHCYDLENHPISERTEKITTPAKPKVVIVEGGFGGIG